MQRVFFSQAAVLGIIAILYFYFGLHEHFFWTVFWWDIVLHVLGGLWVALAAAWFASLFGYRLTPLQAAICAVVVGIAWELFEYLLDIGGSAFMSYPVDTAKDLIDDAVGGALGALFLRRV